MNAETRAHGTRLPVDTGRPTHTVVDPAALAAAARAELSDALYRSHGRIFDGVRRADFAAYVVDSPATWTRIFVQRDGAGEVRGYCAFHVYDVMHAGRSVAVVRMEAGFERAWRGGGAYTRFSLKCFARARLHAGGRPLYFVCCPVHPSSFVVLSRYAPQRWTVPGAQTPPAARRFMRGLAESLGMKAVGDGIYDIGWITRGAEAPARIRPAAAEYIAANPGYTRGHGLLTVVPVTIGGITRGALRVLGRSLRARVG